MTVVDYLTREHGRVNVNLAGPEEMALVLGLTPAEAAAIVRYRRDRGTFENAEAVARVPGVDARKILARRDAIVFGSRVASNAGRVPVAALTAANNWPSVNGGPQREGWARPEAMLSRNTVGAVELLYSRQLDNRNRGPNALTPPLVLGNLISYRGFKEMLFVGGSSDVVYSIDAVLNRVLWTTRLPVKEVQATPAGPQCAGGLMGIVMTGSAAAGLTGAPIRRPGALAPGVLPAAATSKSELVVGLASGFGRNGLVVSVGSDGNVYPLYQSNGAVLGSPLKFLPANSSVRGLNLYDNTLYAATIDGCSGPNAVYALDLATDQKTVARFDTGSSARGSAGTAIGSDGTVFVQTADRVLALGAKDLKAKDYLLLSSTASGPDAARDGVTPMVFPRSGKDVVVSADREGRLVLLDGSALGGGDHRTPLTRTQSVGTVRGAFASWEDPETGTRWIYAPVWASTKTSKGAIAAFKLDDRNNRLALSLEWTSRDMIAPVAPVIANGLVFALSAGDADNDAVFYIVDATTGKQLFTSGADIKGSASEDAGLAVANGRVYFSTTDNTLYSFGIRTEH
jgi:competence ComEA-like helix-hairpin-helix protein